MAIGYLLLTWLGNQYDQILWKQADIFIYDLITFNHVLVTSYSLQLEHENVIMRNMSDGNNLQLNYLIFA